MDSRPISLLIIVALATLRTSHSFPAHGLTLGHTHATISPDRSDEGAVQRVRHMLLRALNLQHIPRIHTETVRQLRSMWRTRLQAASHIPGETAGGQRAGNETHSQGEVTVAGTNESTTPSSSRHCCQTAAQISLTDLGWEHWIVYPEQITYVDCASCRHPRDVVSFRCHRNQTSGSNRGHRRHCCRAVKTAWIPIMYMDEDLSLVINNIPLTEECGEGP